MEEETREFQLDRKLAELTEFLTQAFVARVQVQAMITAELKKLTTDADVSVLTEKVEFYLINAFHIGKIVDREGARTLFLTLMRDR